MLHSASFLFSLKLEGNVFGFSFSTIQFIIVTVVCLAVAIEYTFISVVLNKALYDNNNSHICIALYIVIIITPVIGFNC